MGIGRKLLGWYGLSGLPILSLKKIKKYDSVNNYNLPRFGWTGSLSGCKRR